MQNSTQQIHSFAMLEKTLKDEPQNLAGLLKTDVDWFLDVRAQKPFRAKNAAKITKIILEGREKLRKTCSLGLDASLKPAEFVAKFVGVKPSKQIFQLAHAATLVDEAVFDKSETSQLQALARLSQKAGDYTLKNAMKLAKTALEKGDKDAFADVMSRVVETEPNSGSWTFKTAQQVKEMEEAVLRETSVSTARLLKIDQLLAVAFAEVQLNPTKQDPKVLDNAEVHARMILDKIAEIRGPATPEKVAELKAVENHVAA